jgi:TonB family protein
MPNDLPTQPDLELPAAAAPTDAVELDLNFGFPVEDKSIFVDLYEALRDVLFPPKLPPLELTSTPLPVPDPMAVKRNPWAVGLSTLLNGGIIAILLFTVVKPMIDKKPVVAVTPIDLTEPKLEGPKGGGGTPDKAPPVQGKAPPKIQTPQVTPQLLETPPPTVNLAEDIPDSTRLPNFGNPNSSVKLGSGGSGTGGGGGNGHGLGYGNGNGNGWGDGLEHVGGKITAPVAYINPDPDFSDEARRAKYQGVVIVAIIVDAQGNPQNPRIVRALGMGLDEKAIEAVMMWRFHPALKAGKPVAVPINVEINFRLY